MITIVEKRSLADKLLLKFHWIVGANMDDAFSYRCCQISGVWFIKEGYQFAFIFISVYTL